MVIILYVPIQTSVSITLYYDIDCNNGANVWVHYDIHCCTANICHYDSNPLITSRFLLICLLAHFRYYVIYDEIKQIYTIVRYVNTYDINHIGIIFQHSISLILVLVKLAFGVFPHCFGPTFNAPCKGRNTGFT